MNFLVQPMPPSTDYMLHFPGFNEIWCDLTSYEVPNVMISELCCSCQKERHGFSSGPSSILLSINFSIFSCVFVCVCFECWLELDTSIALCNLSSLYTPFSSKYSGVFWTIIALNQTQLSNHWTDQFWIWQIKSQNLKFQLTAEMFIYMQFKIISLFWNVLL